MLVAASRKLFAFPVMLASIVVLWVYLAAGHGVGDPDIWWHLKNAEHLFQNGRLPDSDLFSFTMAGHPWVNHEWLAEIPYYLAWRAGGLTGLYVLFLLLLIVILLGNFYWAFRTSGNLKGAFLVGCYSVLLAAVSFGPRMILFGYLAMLLLLLLLWRERTSGDAPLWTMPLIFCFWINCHASWLFGFILLAIFMVSGLWEGSWGRVEARRWSRRQFRRLLAYGGVSVAALFVNPIGYRLVFYPFEFIFEQKLNVASIDEWASVNFHDARGKVVLAFLAALFLGALLRNCRWKLEEVLLAGLGIYLGLTHIRFLFLAALVTAPFAARLLDLVPPYRPEIDKAAINAVILAGVLTVVVARFPSEAKLQRDVEQRYPEAALRYMEQQGIRGRTFHDYVWGGYLVWRAPWMKTFVDGRTDIFETGGVLKDYLDVLALKDSFAVLDRHRIDFVMARTDSRLAYLVENSENWKLTYRDEVTSLYERARPISTQPASQAGLVGAGAAADARP
jgi:hypothetical protein